MTSRVKRTIQNLTDVLTKEQTAIIKVASLLMIPALLTKITGLIFTLLTATRLGTDRQLNEFLFANELPQFLADILLTGAISTLVIPIFIQVREEEGDKAFRRFYNTILNSTIGVFVFVSLVVLIFADQIFPLVVDLIIRPDSVGLAIIRNSTPNIVAMMRAMMVPQLILGISVFVAAGINVYERFLIPQIAPLFYNVGRIFSVFILLPLMNNSPWALVIGVYLGAVLHLVVQAPLARMLGLRHEFVLDFGSKYVKRFWRVTWPRMIAYTADMAGNSISRLIIAGYGANFISIMFYVGSLANVIPGVIGYAFSVASFPALAKLYNRGEFGEINKIVIQIVNQIVFLAAPIVITMAVLRLPVVRLIYGLMPSTSFDRFDTLAVAWGLLFVSLGIIFAATKWYLYRLFYVAQNTLIPLFVSFISLGMTVILTKAFANLLSHSDNFAIGSIQWRWENLLVDGGGNAAIGGASLALSVTVAVEFFLLLFLVHKVVIPLDFRDLFGRLLKKFIPATASGVLMFFMYKTWDVLSFPIDARPGFGGSTTLNLAILTSLTVFTCFMVYYLLCHLLGVEELRILRRILNPLFRLGGFEIGR